MAGSRLQGLSPAAAHQLVAAAQAIESGGPELAEARLRPVLARFPGHPEVLRVVAGILSLRGNHRRALMAMRQAIAQRPDDPLYHNTLASILAASHDLNGAIAALQRACEIDPTLAIAWYNLGVMLTQSVRHEEAIEALKQAVRLNPQHMEARALLSDMLRTQGRITEASEQYRRMVAERPAFGMGWWGLANLKVTRFSEADIVQMRRALQSREASDHDLIALGFALAKALDDQGRYAESLEALKRANAIGRGQRQWDADAFSRSVSSMLEAFPVAAPSVGPDLGREVIFVIGLPRSGTTLVEQILATHSRVEGAGELPDLPLTLTEESKRRQIPFPQWAPHASPEDWRRLGLRYLGRTERWRQRRPQFVDKLPSNWTYIGAIRSMLPGAKIVACKRDPLEACFSCYRQLLAGNEYARSFEDLAAYWTDYDRSIAFWRSHAPDHLYEHSYERLIAEPEDAVRGLLAFCGLPFEEACLRFYETDREVRSPSAMQVRQPLHDTSRTARYGELLDPLRKALGYRPFAAPAE